MASIMDNKPAIDKDNRNYDFALNGTKVIQTLFLNCAVNQIKIF